MLFLITVYGSSKFGGLQLFCTQTDSSWPTDQAVARTQKACEDISLAGHGNKLMNHLLKMKEKGSRNT